MSSYFGSLFHQHEIKSVVKNIITKVEDSENITEKIKNASPNLLFQTIIIGIIFFSFLIRSKLSSDIFLSIFFVLNMLTMIG